MFKNVASQKLTVYVWDTTTGLPKTGDAANLTAYRSLDDGAVTVLSDTSATEKDATNAKGFYDFDLTQGESNGDKILFSCKSSTANIACLAYPSVVYTVPPNFTTMVIDSTGRLNAFLIGILTSVFTEGATGRIAAAFKQFFNIASPAATMDHGVLVDTATALTDAPSDSSGVTTLLTRVTAAVATQSSLSGLITTVGVAGAGLTAADDAVLTAIAALNNVAAGAAMTLTSGERNAIADALFARSLGTEAVSADAAVPTLAQAMFELLAKLGEFSISGTTITYKKRDGSTTLFTATIDDASTPTSITRAT